MEPRTAWESLTMPASRFLTSRWPWRSVVYLLTGTLLGAATFTVIFLLLVGVASTVVYVVGVLLLLGFLLSSLVVANLERRRLRIVDDYSVDAPRHGTDRGGWSARAAARLREAITWRELAYTLMSALALWWMDALFLALGLLPFVLIIGTPMAGYTEPWVNVMVVAVGLGLLPASAYAITAWAGARAEIARSMLAPMETELGQRLTAVTNSRARLVDAFEAERRRIERDLHDGTQQRLIALGVELGLARLDVPADTDPARHLAAAQRHATLAMQELREVVRGIRPQPLVERGLAAAVDDILTRIPVPVDARIDLPCRLPGSVENIAYFAISEALANVVKHARATRAKVTGNLTGDILVIEVSDDGIGGARPNPGSGLSGLVDRLAVADGRVYLSSPSGGPTVVRFEVPCPTQAGTP